MARFVLVLGSRRFVLPPGNYRIGRSPDCEVHLDDDSVSRDHGVLRVDGQSTVIEDLQSSNGIYVNGVRVEGERTLEREDRIAIGSTQMRLIEERVPQQDEELLRPTARMPQLEEAGGRKEAADALVDPLSVLSPREREVLRLIARGCSQRQAAEELGISTKSVETYRSRVANKLGLQARTDFVRLALRAGLLEDA